MLPVQAAEHIVLGRPLHVVADEQVKAAVTVRIKPQRGRAQGLPVAEATGVGNVDESSLPAILEKPVLSNTCDQDVGKTVVVVIAHGDAHSIHLYIETDFVGYVGKSTVAVVVVEPKRGRLALVAGPVHAVNKENVLPAVAIVVEEGAARAERFGKKLASVRATVVLKLMPAERVTSTSLKPGLDTSG